MSRFAFLSTDAVEILMHFTNTFMIEMTTCLEIKLLTLDMDPVQWQKVGYDSSILL